MVMVGFPFSFDIQSFFLFSFPHWSHKLCLAFKFANRWFFYADVVKAFSSFSLLNSRLNIAIGFVLVRVRGTKRKLFFYSVPTKLVFDLKKKFSIHVKLKIFHNRAKVRLSMKTCKSCCSPYHRRCQKLIKTSLKANFILCHILMRTFFLNFLTRKAIPSIFTTV